MRTLHLHIPESVDKNDSELTMLIASKLYEDGTLSSGQAAELAGISKRSFIELLGRYGVSVFSTSLEDLESDIANA
jgi:predicted HTH domain antitoxin